MSPNLILSVAYLITEVLKAGVEWKEILDAVDATGKVSDEMRAKIGADQKSWEAAWEAKRRNPGP